LNKVLFPGVLVVSLVIMISSLPTANGLFLEWDGVIDEQQVSGSDPLGHQWTWNFDIWRMEDETWQGHDWVTDFHIEFSGLTPGNQIFGNSFVIEKQRGDINWNCKVVDETKLECNAIDSIHDRLYPGEVFSIAAAFNEELDPAITFDAEWTMDEVSNGLFVQWDGVIDEDDDFGFDPLGHQWDWSTTDTWRMEDETWQGDGWVTDFHIEFSGLSPGNQIFGGFFVIEKQRGDISWNCKVVDETKLECFAIDSIHDRLYPGEVFSIAIPFNSESDPAITFDAEWTKEGIGNLLAFEIKLNCAPEVTELSLNFPFFHRDGDRIEKQVLLLPLTCPPDFNGVVLLSEVPNGIDAGIFAEVNGQPVPSRFCNLDNLDEPPNFNISIDIDPITGEVFCEKGTRSIATLSLIPLDSTPPPPDDDIVGGKIIPIETTSLLLAGAQTFSWMIPVVLSGIGIGLFVVSRKSENS